MKMDSDGKLEKIFEVTRDWEIDEITDLEGMKRIIIILEDLDV